MDDSSFEQRISLLFLCYEQNSSRNLNQIFKNLTQDSDYFGEEELNNQEILLSSHFFYDSLSEISRKYVNYSVAYYKK